MPVMPVPVGNSGPDILMVQPAQYWYGQGLTDGLDGAGDRRVLLVRARLVVVVLIRFQQMTQMLLAKHMSALEVHIFPEAMRGTGEGHYPWDLRPQSTMTNANVEQVVTAVDGQTLTLKYKDGEKKIFVPADTPIVIY